jgi:cytochrome c oxidase subunit 1
MTVAALLFFIVFFGTIFSKRKEEPVLELPVSEALHDEKRIPLFDTFKPWLVTMAVILMIAYTPALIDATKNPGKGAPRFLPQSPTPVEDVTPAPSAKVASEKTTVTLANR